ncbi:MULTISPECIES: hypothetical protein [Streptococcus]|uniref:Bacteriocin n=1 Tax=Streptococcus macedonicus TaxID=59310 RepID=A0A2G3NTZ9_STRMC|nr:MULTISPECIES: hypothetical protein [Streptococcus]CCF03193.1 Hypothetical protein SMA_1902 [Streptococcus macedonicus ACA-DC 198]ALT80209.1 bacteriocin [Streptococcus gallolyticus]MBT1047344.1 bacteriocin [Streptococcus macedonicus]MCW8485921.1 bacteriocin [Streptococcus macedonicus]MCW8495023.1 bacteriocin [Streptococcus macedonicus]
MLEVLAGIACLLLAGYQLFTAYKLFDNTKKHCNKNTSPFLLDSLWSGALISIILSSVAADLIVNIFKKTCVIQCSIGHFFKTFCE